MVAACFCRLYKVEDVMITEPVDGIEDELADEPLDRSQDPAAACGCYYSGS